MISLGNNIQSNCDALEKISLNTLAESIIAPSVAVKEKIKRLRIVYNLDTKQYRNQKKELPYFVCGIFNPPYRRSENFAYTEYFIVDLDHLSEHGITLEELRNKLIKDKRIFLLFSSPSKNGLKLVFKLSERCYDAGLYSIFYKAFSNHLADTYNIAEIIDYSTHDVSRACFLSWDEDAYYAPLADTINMQQFVDLDSPIPIFELKRELEKNLKEQNAQQSENVGSTREPTDDIIGRIKAKLRQRQEIKNTENKTVFVPEQVERIIEGLKLFIGQFDIEVSEITNIQYGKKIRFRLESKSAELNLFYGKRGYTVVETPRAGTSKELNKLCADIVKQYISEIR
jgi:hypothetical protein